MPSRADEVNLENDLKSSRSIFAFYRKLLEMRHALDVLRHGSFKDLTYNEEGYFMFERKLDNQLVTVIINFDKKKKLPYLKELKKRAKQILSNFDGVSLFNTLKPFEIAVFLEEI